MINNGIGIMEASLFKESQKNKKGCLEGAAIFGHLKVVAPCAYAQGTTREGLLYTLVRSSRT